MLGTKNRVSWINVRTYYSILQIKKNSRKYRQVSWTEEMIGNIDNRQHCPRENKSRKIANQKATHKQDTLPYSIKMVDRDKCKLTVEGISRSHNV